MTGDLIKMPLMIEQIKIHTPSLPAEILVLIFESIDLNSLLQCRLVCKVWNATSYKVRYNNVTAITRPENHFAISNKLEEHILGSIRLFTNDPISSSTLLRAWSIDFFRINLVKSVLSRVRQLSFDHVNVLDVELWTLFATTLSELDVLEQLEIRYLNMKDSNTITLNSVEVLSIKRISSVRVIDSERLYASSLTINAPKLKKLAWPESLQILTLSHPEEISHLILKEGSLKGLNQSFNGCEYLSLNAHHYTTEYFEIAIRKFPNLNEIHHSNHWYLERFVLHKEDIINRLQLVQSLNKQNLKVYFDDFLLNNEDDVLDLLGRQYCLENVSNQMMLANYAKLADQVQTISKLDYILLMDHFQNQLPSDFSARFVAIKSVRVNDTVHIQTDFIKFIRGCKTINKLYLKHSSIGQDFYDLLYLYTPLLVRLEIDEDRVTLNSSFIMKCNYLQNYSINQTVSFDTTKFMFERKQPRFKQLECMLNGRMINVSFVNLNMFNILDRRPRWYNEHDFLQALKKLLN